MTPSRLSILLLAVCLWPACAAAANGPESIVRRIVRPDAAAPNLVPPDGWRPYGEGFAREGEAIVCDNGADAGAVRGATQVIVLNQKAPMPIVARAEARAESVGGARNSDFALYLDLLYADGDHLWGRAAPFDPGTHDWQRGEVRILPEKPVRQISAYLLLRRHAGKAAFRNAVVQQLHLPDGAGMFDGLMTTEAAAAKAGDAPVFAVRDVAKDSDFVEIGNAGALGLKLDVRATRRGPATFHNCTVTDTTGQDRAIVLAMLRPVDGADRWLAGPRGDEAPAPGREYRWLEHSGRIGKWPFAAIARANAGKAVGIDLAAPAIFRAGFSAAARPAAPLPGTPLPGTLYVACDVGLAKERPTAAVRLVEFDFDAAWGFRGALAAFHGIFPEQFACRTPRQGLWMPFFATSKVKGWEDFGFAFKEGDGETAWDDAHGLLTFRYTEPMTWWMRMPKGMPRTIDAALAEARRLAESGTGSTKAAAKALLTSGFHDKDGRFIAQLRDTPWCDGAVWSMNSSPAVPGEVTDFKNKWNPALKEKLYGASRKADLDGEYVDSIEGWVTDELDFRRDHFAAAQTPLTFDPASLRPAIHKGLISFEYTRAIGADLRPAGKFMMANGAIGQYCWLAPLVDVTGQETDWNRGGKWQPMSDAELIYRRALCAGKPYCFLMNTQFDRFGPDRVEKYMTRCLAYGMFPGFFSADASTGHYFSRPELYDRDRPLFKKYVPLCRKVAEAGWQPITNARSGDPKVYVERWGDRLLTVFNDSDTPRKATIALAGLAASAAAELVEGKPLPLVDGKLEIIIDPEGVRVVELTP